MNHDVDRVVIDDLAHEPVAHRADDYPQVPCEASPREPTLVQVSAPFGHRKYQYSWCEDGCWNE